MNNCIHTHAHTRIWKKEANQSKVGIINTLFFPLNLWIMFHGNNSWRIFFFHRFIRYPNIMTYYKLWPEYSFANAFFLFNICYYVRAHTYTLVHMNIGIPCSYTSGCDSIGFTATRIHTKCANHSIAGMRPSILQWVTRIQSTTSEWKRSTTIVQLHRSWYVLLYRLLKLVYKSHQHLH